jgi:hypothetical protein
MVLVKTFILITTLNVNGLNSPIKRNIMTEGFFLRRPKCPCVEGHVCHPCYLGSGDWEDQLDVSIGKKASDIPHLNKQHGHGGTDHQSYAGGVGRRIVI